MNRRSVIKGAALAATISPLGNIAAAQGMRSADDRPGRMPLPIGPTLQPGERPFRIAMIIYEAMTNQDFVGPQDAFASVRVTEIDVIAKTLDPITTDSGVRVLPDKTFAQADEKYDLLFIGGGPGCTRLMEDPEVMGFLQSRGAHAKYITSVCTGALVLGAAGLLKGYKAATHWSAMEVLSILGAIPTHERVVFDRNRITGGGVTAGIDFALAVIGQLWGDEYAEILQLDLEYDPHPPYNMGSPRKASPAVLDQCRKMVATSTQQRKDAAVRAAAKLKLS